MTARGRRVQFGSNSELGCKRLSDEVCRELAGKVSVDLAGKASALSGSDGHSWEDLEDGREAED